MKKKVVGLTAALAAVTLAVPLFSAPAAQTAAPQIVKHAPRIPAVSSGIQPNASGYGWSSTNWSGYAITGSGYNDITGYWTVPSVSATSGSSYSSAWIGIDGFNNNNLIQTGTESDYYSGSAHYYAWWEILPAAETRISMSVHPGDKMYAHIHNNGGGVWNIYIQDQSTGASFSTNQNYNGKATSAEWIQEAPTVNGSVATLSHYSTFTFDPGTVNGVSPNFAQSNGGYMVNRSGSIISIPSVPDGDRDGFNVSYGSSAPAAPAS